MKRDGSVYYPKLESEIVLRGIHKQDIQKHLNCKMGTFMLKLNGERRFTLDEAIKIQEACFPDVSVNDLFRHE